MALRPEGLKVSVVAYLVRDRFPSVKALPSPKEGIVADFEFTLFQEAIKERDEEIERLRHLLAVAVRKIRRDAQRRRLR